MHDRGCDWFCDGCGVRMNDQPRFTTVRKKWKCKACGYVNDVSENNIIPAGGSNGYVFTKKHENGLIERIRFTKTREVHDFDGPNGKMSIWKRRGS